MDGGGPLSSHSRRPGFEGDIFPSHVSSVTLGRLNLLLGRKSMFPEIRLLLLEYFEYFLQASTMRVALRSDGSIIFEMASLDSW